MQQSDFLNAFGEFVDSLRDIARANLALADYEIVKRDVLVVVNAGRDFHGDLFDRLAVLLRVLNLSVNFRLAHFRLAHVQDSAQFVSREYFHHSTIRHLDVPLEERPLFLNY